MRSTRSGSFALLLVALGCGDGGTGPAGITGLNGNFAGFFGAQREILTIQVQEQNGVLSGEGWATVTGALQGGGTLSGSYSGQHVEFDLRPLTGAAAWHFSGEFSADTLKGEFALVPGSGFVTELARVDVVPTGRATLELSGGLQVNTTGRALFGYVQPGFELVLSIQVSGQPSWQVRIEWGRSSLPGPGTYALRPDGGTPPTVSFIRIPGTIDPLALPLISGSLELEAASRHGMIGSFELEVIDPLSFQQSRVRASFSAGCVSAYC